MRTVGRIFVRVLVIAAIVLFVASWLANKCA